MKYTKREQRAVDCLYEIASALKEGKPIVDITGGDLTVIKNVLGIDFKKITKSKTEVEKDFELVKSKEGLLFAFDFFDCGRKSRHCYFPFQIKAKQTHEV